MTSAELRLALPETVSVAMSEIVQDMREGLLAITTRQASSGGPPPQLPRDPGQRRLPSPTWRPPPAVNGPPGTSPVDVTKHAIKS